MKELVEFAQSTLYGIKEVIGNKDNPVIMSMFHDIGFTWVKHDETAWCAAAHCWIHKQLGYSQPKSLRARDWESFGRTLTTPEYGCTVVFWRISKESGYGHVGFFIREDENYIWVLGGNQSNSYKIQKYSKKQLLSYREILKYAVS